MFPEFSLLFSSLNIIVLVTFSLFHVVTEFLKILIPKHIIHLRYGVACLSFASLFFF